jgi:carboxypeptidase Q
MNFRNLLVLAAVVASNLTYAVTDDELAVMRDSALTSTDGYDIVEALTTKVGARLAGTDADKRAVVWAKDLLEQSALTKSG